MTWYDEDCIVVDKYLFAGNPVECVVHPDLWNKTKLWDPLGIGENFLERSMKCHKNI